MTKWLRMIAFATFLFFGFLLIKLILAFDLEGSSDEVTAQLIQGLKYGLLWLVSGLLAGLYKWKDLFN